MMWTIIRDLVAGGVTIFLTTQYLDEADQLADRIAVLHLGRLAGVGPASDYDRQSVVELMTTGSRGGRAPDALTGTTSALEA